MRVIRIFRIVSAITVIMVIKVIRVHRSYLGCYMMWPTDALTFQYRYFVWAVTHQGSISITWATYHLRCGSCCGEECRVGLGAKKGAEAAAPVDLVDEVLRVPHHATARSLPPEECRSLVFRRKFRCFRGRGARVVCTKKE